MMVNAAIVTTGNVPALPAVILSMMNGTVVPHNVTVYDASNGQGSVVNSAMFKGMVEHFNINVVKGGNTSDIHNRLAVLQKLKGLTWYLDDDCYPIPTCLELLLQASLLHATVGVQGCKIDIVRKDQFLGNDWNWANQYRPFSTKVLWLDACCMLITAERYCYATERVIDAYGTDIPLDSSHCGDVAVGALYAQMYGAVASGNAIVYHIPDTPARWDNLAEVDANTVKVLQRVLPREYFETFQKRWLV